MFCRRVLTSSAGISVNKHLTMNLNKGDGNGCNNKEVCSNSKESRRCTEGSEEGYAGRQEDRQGHGEANGQEDGCQGRRETRCQEARRQKSSCQGCCQTRCQGREAGSQEAGRQETRSQEVVYWYQNWPRCVSTRAGTARLFLWEGRRACGRCPHR